MRRRSIQRIALSLLFFILTPGCTFPLRNHQILETDTHFILLNYSVKSESVRSAIKRLKDSSSPGDRNNLAVFQIRNSELDSAEKLLKELVGQEKENTIPLLNLIRLYFISDEYPELRNFFAEYVQSTGYDKVRIAKILGELEKQRRSEERIILLDTLTNLPGFELKAMEELGIYFTNLQDYKEAAIYFEKILQVDSFNNTALFHLTLISVELERWKDVLLYAGNISDEKGKSPEVHLFLIRANYELGKFSEAVRLAEKAPSSAKESLEFLTVWRNAILASDIRASLSPLLKVFRILQKKGLKMQENEFFPSETKEGQETLQNLIRGY